MANEKIIVLNFKFYTSQEIATRYSLSSVIVISEIFPIFWSVKTEIISNRVTINSLLIKICRYEMCGMCCVFVQIPF